MRLEADRRHLTLPVIGKLRSKEHTRRLQRLVAKDQARVLSMTLSEEGGRLFVSVATIVAQAPCHPSEPDTLTTQLARRFGRIVVEDLDIAAMGRGMGRRAFRRSVYRAGLGQVRPPWPTRPAGPVASAGADRWFASSKLHHGCGGYLAGLILGQRIWICPFCGQTAGRLTLQTWACEAL
jgi:transposase